MEKEKSGLDWFVPIRFILMTWVSLIVIYWLPNPWWGIALKVLLGIWILYMFMSSFSPMWKEYKYLFAFVVFNNLWLAGILWINKPSWLIYIFALLIVLTFLTEYKAMKES